MDSLADAALDYLKLGWGVIPLHSVREGRCSCPDPDCTSPGKHPRIAWEPYKTRLATEDEVRSWWQKWPDANIGIVTGAISGLLVLDVDGKEGRETLRRRNLRTYPTAIVNTGGGGWHYYYRHPGGHHPNTTGKVGPKVDSRGDAGYVVAPPSLHVSGNHYEWATSPRDCPLADPPPWLCEINKPHRASATAPPFPQQIPQGQRETFLTSYAGSMRQRAASEEAILAALQVENSNRCQPPLPDQQVRKIAASVARYVPGQRNSIFAGKKAIADRTGEEDAGQPLEPRFRMASELRSIAAEHPEWLVENLCARGCVSFLAGKVKAGKTTFAIGLCGAIVRGESFLSYPTTRAGVLYLTEERAPTFRASLERAGLLDAERFALLLHHEAGELTWPETVVAAVEHAKNIGAALLVVDTLSHWAGVQDENDSAQAIEAMRSLHLAAADGLAVLVVAHGRKSGGEVGDDARGSSAYGGAADILLSLRRANQPGHETRRELEVVSRFDGGPGKVIIERDAEGYRLVGDPGELERAHVREALLDTLPHEEGEAATFATLLDALGCSKITLERALDELLAEGEVAREKGAGKATKRSYGYWLSAIQRVGHVLHI